MSEIERRMKIIDYLQDNSWAKIKGKDKRINKSDVMRYMEDTSRKMTTHKIITDLIKERKIKPEKDKPHSQTHYLVINDEDKFNKINQEMAGMEVDFKKLEIPKKHLNPEDMAILRIFQKLLEIERLPSKDSQMLYPKLKKVMFPLADKLIRAWSEADKQRKEDLKSKTR